MSQSRGGVLSPLSGFSVARHAGVPHGRRPEGARLRHPAWLIQTEYMVAVMQAAKPPWASRERGHLGRHPESARRWGCPCRGSATLIVLLMISVALALSYAAVRLQGTALGIQQNAQLGMQARQAALTGLVLALKHMHSGSWEGVDTTYARSLEPNCGFEATYTTGDAALLPGDAQYEEYPYRVTVAVTGYTTDPADNRRVITHRVEAVVRLIPRRTSQAPSGWNDITDHTLCQWKSGSFVIQSPARIEGPVRIRAKLRLCKELEWHDSARWAYLGGLRQMFYSGATDARPFGSPVRLNYNNQTEDTLNLLWYALDLSTENYGDSTAFSLWIPTNWTSYRLYRGGKTYYAQAVLSDQLSQIALEADPLVNPLGIFHRNTDLVLAGDTTIRGTLLTADGRTLHVSGSNNRVVPLDLPPYTQPSRSGELRLRLPAVLCGDHFVLQPGAVFQAEGLLLAKREFKVERAAQNATQFHLCGRLAAETIRIEARQEWVQSSKWWEDAYDAWYAQRYVGIRRFPQWLDTVWSLHWQPRITIQADSGTASYHWPDLKQPLFLPHPDDASPLDAGNPGLRWEVVRWKLR